MQPHLLVIENPPSIVHDYLNRDLGSHLGSRCELAKWGSLPFEKLQQCHAQLLVAVAIPSAPVPIELFKWLREHPIPSPTLAVLSSEVDDETLSVVSQATDDFVLWPIHKVELRHRLQRMVGPETKRDELESAHDRLTEILGMEQLIGEHPKFIRAVKIIPLIAKSDLPVLITGATGTGKELCARAIHLLSKHRSFPFIPVDAGAIPDHLFENELFGHARGAFTDAHAAQKGLAAMAEGGTLFLDEVDALSPTAQAKLLRFLQERTYKPLGSDNFIKAAVNIIAATNRDLETCVQEKQFRADLYFRLNALRLDLPRLAERGGDILVLARHFLRFQNPPGSIRKSLTLASTRKLESHNWPGNVRELYNVIQRAILFAEGQYILPEHLAVPVPNLPDEGTGSPFHDARIGAIKAFEKDYVERLLQEHNGSVTRAALAAGKDRRAFGRLKKKYGVTFVRQKG
ncbi:MAG: sigma 54-interacting transcriptional regulator [Pyrinomonadaceae bacterium]